MTRFGTSYSCNFHIHPDDDCYYCRGRVLMERLPVSVGWMWPMEPSRTGIVFDTVYDVVMLFKRSNYEG